MAYWHVGKMKTASTYMQKYVFPKIQNVRFLGWYTKDSERQWDDSYVESMVSNIRRSSDFSVKDNRALFVQLQKSAGLSDFLISDEGIATDIGNAERNLNRINSIDNEAKIILVIREQRSYLLSQYNQYIKGVYSNKKWRFLTLSDWLDGVGNKHVKECYYSRLLGVCYDLFGREDSLIIPYELMKSNPEMYSQLFSVFLGCDIKSFSNAVSGSSPVHTSKLPQKYEMISLVALFLLRIMPSFAIGYLSHFKLYGLVVASQYTREDVTKLLQAKGVDYSDDNSIVSSEIGIDLKGLKWMVY